MLPGEVFVQKVKSTEGLFAVPESFTQPAIAIKHLTRVIVGDTPENKEFHTCDQP